MKWAQFLRRLSRRGITWIFYVVLASLVPIGVLAFALHSFERLTGWNDILSNGELIIIAVTISAGSVGDLLSTERRKALSLVALICVSVSILNVFAGSMIYGWAAVQTRVTTSIGDVTTAQMTNITMASGIIFALSCAVGLSTIVLTTWWQEEDAVLGSGSQG